MNTRILPFSQYYKHTRIQRLKWFDDDFENGNYTTNPTWSVDMGNATIESVSPLAGNYSVNVYRSATSAGRLSTTYSTSPGIRLKAKVKMIDNVSRAWLLLLDSVNNNFISVELSYQHNKIIASKNVDGVTTSSEVAWAADADAHDLVLQWYGGNVTAVLDDIVKVSQPITEFNSLLQIGLDGSGSTSGVSGGIFDNVSVREYKE